jgi:hypothetical protein
MVGSVQELARGEDSSGVWSRSGYLFNSIQFNSKEFYSGKYSVKSYTLAHYNTVYTIIVLFSFCYIMRSSNKTQKKAFSHAVEYYF